jgi:hypothetical protein
MRSALWLCALLASAAATAQGQQPRTPRDTATRDSTRARRSAADSAAAADSAFLEQALKGERPGAQPPADTTRPTNASVGPTNPRLLPDISAVGDFVGDLTPTGSTQEDQTRFSVREIELAVQAAVDPYFRGDIFLGINDLEGIAVEQAYLTTTSLPYGLEVRLGRYLMPVGKQNTTHRHDLHTTEYPWVVQRFFGPEGLKGTGVWLSKIFAPLGFYQELQVTAVDRFGERPEGLTTAEPVNKRLGDIGYSARLRNYWDLSQAANLEVAASAITGRRERPLGCVTIEGESTPCPEALLANNAVAARQSVVGADLTYRWRPLQQGLYKSFILQAEVMRQLNESLAAPAPPAQFLTPARGYTGAYVFARNQITRRGFLGARYDWLQDPENGGRTLWAGSGYLEWFPSEFSKLSAGYERLQREGLESRNRILLQATFALGPHKPHPF